MDSEFWKYLGVYVAGVLSIPMVYLLAVTAEWLTTRNMELECGKCHRKFGNIRSKPITLNIVTNIKFHWHVVSGQCKRNAKNG